MQSAQEAPSSWYGPVRQVILHGQSTMFVQVLNGYRALSAGSRSPAFGQRMIMSPLVFPRGIGNEITFMSKFQVCFGELYTLPLLTCPTASEMTVKSILNHYVGFLLNCLGARLYCKILISFIQYICIAATVSNSIFRLC